MTNRVVITLTDEQKARFEEIAKARQEPFVAAVEEAVADYLDYDAEFREAVQRGLDDIAAGRTRPWTEVKAELRAKFGDPDD
jgi:predicted transcriptional regulator